MRTDKELMKLGLKQSADAADDDNDNRSNFN